MLYKIQQNIHLMVLLTLFFTFLNTFVHITTTPEEKKQDPLTDPQFFGH